MPEKCECLFKEIKVFVPTYEYTKERMPHISFPINADDFHGA